LADAGIVNIIANDPARQEKASMIAKHFVPTSGIRSFVIMEIRLFVRLS